MSSADALRKYLRDQYGITSDRELHRAVKEMPRINIAVFTEKTKERNEDGREIA